MDIGWGHDSICIDTYKGDNSVAVERLLREGTDVNARNNHRATPLHLACAREEPRIEIIRMLCSHGADLNAVNNKGKTPYDMTDLGVVRQLLVYLGYNGRL